MIGYIAIAIFVFLIILFAFLARLQRTMLRRNNLKLTIQDAKKEFRFEPFVYLPAYTIIIPTVYVWFLIVMKWFPSRYDSAEAAFWACVTGAVAYVIFFIIVILFWKIHHMLVFVKPAEPTIELQTQKVDTIKVSNLHNCIFKDDDKVYYDIYQVIDENGNSFYIKGERYTRTIGLDYKIKVFVGQQTDRLYFKKVWA